MAKVGDAAGAATTRTNGRTGTSTYRFGAGRREGHDAGDFYERFPVPEVSSESDISPHAAVDEIWTGDARDMDSHGTIADNSVALVVTSPPYFAGKEYEAALGEGHIPKSYADFLAMLADVFAECKRKLEPGGRIAVNVANLGRKPYRSLSADVIDILQRLGLLLRGEVIWVKGKAAGGSCAWGSFQQPSNPVLRDLSERVIVASKGRFDRAQDRRKRGTAGLPSVGTITADEFMDLTYDIWELAPESARKVGHPAPFPVELPRRFIELYTYEGDLVLDPFMGAGSTAVAAVQEGRHFVGFDTDPDYVARSRQRVAEVRRQDDDGDATPLPPAVVEVRAEGRKVSDVVSALLAETGWRAIDEKVRAVPGIEVSFKAVDRGGRPWYFDVVGGFSAERPGLRRWEELWKALGKASVLAALEPDARLVLLSPDLPDASGAGGRALAAVTGDGKGKTVVAVVELVTTEGCERLRDLADGA